MTSSTDEETRWIAVGRVGRPHGLDGSFHVTNAISRLLEVGASLRLGAEGARGARSGGGAESAEAADNAEGADTAEGVEGARSRAARDVFVVVRKAGTDRDPILRLEGVGDRDAALALRGLDLLVATTDAPALPQGEWWAHELQGCAVSDGTREVGVVERMIELPSCEALEVRRAGGATLVVPLVKDAVRTVDVKGKRIDVDLRFLGEGP